MNGDHFLLTCPLQIGVARSVWFCEYRREESERRVLLHGVLGSSHQLETDEVS